MAEKYKEVLISSKVLLSRNIVWTDEFSALLKDRNITTDSMLKDLKECENREERVTKLLEFVAMRGQQCYQKFCDILQVTGHYFLADFLRDEENRTDVPDAKDVYKKLPFLEKVLKDNEKSRLESYIIEKIKEEVLREVWKKESEEKDKTLTAKEKQLNQTFAFDEERKTKDTAIAHLTSDIQGVADELGDYKSQVRALSNTLIETEEKFKSDLEKQIKFNLANESSLKRSQDYVKQLEDTLHSVRARLGEVVAFKQKSSMKDQVSEAGFKFAHIMDDVECVVVKIEQLTSLQKKHAALLEEREWILMHLGYAPNDPETPAMVDAYREFAIRTDENIHFLQQEVAKYTELIKRRESTGAASLFIGQPVQAVHRDDIWKGTVISVLKKETHDMRAKLGNRDKKIVQLEKEIISLKSSLKTLRFPGNNSKRPSSRNGKRQYVKPTENGSDNDAIKHTDVNDGATLQLPRLPMTNNFMGENMGPFLVHSLDPMISAKRISIDLSPEKLLNNSQPRISFPNGLRPGQLNGVVDTGQRKSVARSHFDMKQAFGDLENMQARNKYMFNIQSKPPTVKNKRF